jgi:hypothetical protein
LVQERTAALISTQTAVLMQQTYFFTYLSYWENSGFFITAAPKKVFKL